MASLFDLVQPPRRYMVLEFETSNMFDRLVEYRNIRENENENFKDWYELYSYNPLVENDWFRVAYIRKPKNNKTVLLFNTDTELIKNMNFKDGDDFYINIRVLREFETTDLYGNILKRYNKFCIENLKIGTLYNIRLFS